MNQNIRVYETSLKDMKVIIPKYIEDERGYLIKSYCKSLFINNGIDFCMGEMLETWSTKGVLRGMHYQKGSFSQEKIVRVIKGEIFDVCIDLRKESPSFGEWYGEILSSENRKSFFVPKNFAHGFLVLSDTALVSYLLSGEYCETQDCGIRWNDRDINIKWPQIKDMEYIISEKDKGWGSFNEYKEDRR